MKMTLGTGTITNYGSQIRGCRLRQWPYKIPITALSDVQLYIDIGTTPPGTIQYELINTCGLNAGDIDGIVPINYVIGQDTNQNYYATFKGFTGSTACCFVIAITLDSNIYFSEEYCIDQICDDLTLIKGCYGNLDPLISYDREGIYFGPSQGGTVGDPNVVYEHKAYMRDVEVTLNSIKNTYKQGLRRTFRIESEDIFLFWGELVPEWYIKHLDAIFKRGEVYIGSDRYLLDGTAYEKIDECNKAWKPSVTLKENYLQSFSCELDPCTVDITPEPCCDPSGIEATVTTPSTACCDPEIVNADVNLTPP